MIKHVATLASELARVAAAAESRLAEGALIIARLEYPHLDPTPYLARLDAMGQVGRDRVAAVRDGSRRAQIAALNQYVFEEQGFVGNRILYDDPRNSCLNRVLDRATGIPITLAVVYMEVAGRAGVPVDGVNFPGHFLMRCDGGVDDTQDEALVIDPFHGGALLSEGDCRQLLRTHTGDDVGFGAALLAPASTLQILVRMLANLKRLYVRLRSFPQARAVTDLLLALNPRATTDLRDRGLLAYHLEDFSGALRDLEAYLQMSALGDAPADERREEHAQIWEHVKTLRRRVASLN